MENFGLAAGQRLLMAGEDRLLAIDLQSGDRTLLSGPGLGAGPALEEVMAMVLDGPRGRVLVACTEAVYAVELLTGDRQILSGPFVGGGVPLDEVSSLAYDPSAGELLVLSATGSELLRIDEATGNRAQVLVDGGMGPAVDIGLGLQWDLDADIVHMVDMQRGSLKVLDLAHGQWMTVSR